MHLRVMISPEKLQKDHAAIYQQFFAEHDIVLSGQVCYTLFPTSIGKNTHFLFVKEKLPYSIRIGAKKNKTGRLQLEKVDTYDLIKEAFVSKYFAQSTNQAHLVEALIDETYHEEGGKEGRTISFLSEVER